MKVVSFFLLKNHFIFIFKSLPVLYIKLLENVIELALASFKLLFMVLEQDQCFDQMK